MKNFNKLIKEAYLGNPLNEATDFNDPALMKARAAKMADEKEKARQAALDKKYGSSFMDKLDAEIGLKNELSDLDDEREQLMIDMEQEAEPEGGEIADRYGARLNSIEQRMIDIKSELDDLRMYESVNEDRFKKNKDSYIRITEPRFIKDKNNPNFLFIRINYDTGPGVGMALGKETMAGQIRRLSSAEAVRQLENIGRKLSDSFDLEDLEITDLENGVVELFAVSDDFIDMDVKSELSTALLNEELLKEFTVPGGDYRNSYANRLPEEQLTSTDDYELFAEMFPRGEASRILMDPNRKKLFDQHLEWTKDSQYNNVFQHMQYHEVEYEGELYKVHQTQYYNGNYDDFRNPRFTELMISKDGKRMGTYLVDTTEYIEDLKNLDVKKRVSESLNEEFKVGDKVTYLGHPAVVTATKEYNGRDFVSVSYDKGTGKTKASMILVKSGDVKAVNEMEDEIPAFMMRDGMYRELVDDSVSYNDFEKRIYGFVGPKFYKSIHSEHPGALKNFYDKFHITKPNLEEETDTDVGGGAKQAIGLDIDDAHSGDAALDNAVKDMGYNESKGFDFKKMVKEALTPKNLR